MPLPLHALHLAEGASLGALRGSEVVLGSGDPAAAFEALRSTVGLQDRSSRGLLRLTGPERASFLHGQTTNDVEKLVPGSGNAAAMLTNKGKMIGLVRVLARADDLWVECEVGYSESILAALQRSCISEEVEFEDMSPSMGQLGLYGPKAADVLSAVLGGPAPMLDVHAHLELELAGGKTTVLGSLEAGVPGYDLLVPIEGLEPVWRALRVAGEKLGLVPFGEEAFELSRIAAGIPRLGVELTEETNPLEANLERAISYQKGCYVGQEVIAKATFRGHVNKKLAGLCFSGALPAAQAELHLDGRTVGRVTSAVQLPDGRAIGLGYVKRDLAKPGVALQLADGQAVLTAELPFPR